MIRIKNLEKRLSPSFVLKIDELEIKKGDRVALTGLNGSGKSTLLNFPMKKSAAAISRNRRIAFPERLKKTSEFPASRVSLSLFSKAAFCRALKTKRQKRSPEGKSSECSLQGCLQAHLTAFCLMNR